ncbi:MCP four helix bundle domain-containing protein, partial [Acinetobacter baumannii]
MNMPPALPRSPTRWLRIRTRLGLAFAVLLMLLLALAALSVYRLSGLSEGLNRIVDDQAVIRDSVNEVNRNAEAIARKLLALMSPDAGLR